MKEHFTKQIEQGATEMFFYGLQRTEPFTAKILSHKGTLDSFPTNLEFVRMLSDSMPLFKETDGNTRIKELAEQAGIYNLNLSDETEYWILENFAKMIVRECATLAYDGPGGILDHFGVDE